MCKAWTQQLPKTMHPEEEALFEEALLFEEAPHEVCRAGRAWASRHVMYPKFTNAGSGTAAALLRAAPAHKPLTPAPLPCPALPCRSLAPARHGPSPHHHHQQQQWQATRGTWWLV